MESNDIKKLPRRDGDLISVTLKFSNAELWYNGSGVPRIRVTDTYGESANFGIAEAGDDFDDEAVLISFECSDDLESCVYDLDGFELHLDKRDGSIELIDDEHDTEHFRPEVMSAIADSFGWAYTADKDATELRRDNAFANHFAESNNDWHIHYLVRTDELQIGCKRFSREQVEEFLDWYAVNWWQR